MTTLVVLRRGECDWNAAHRWVGRTDRPLTARGREQADAAARSLAGLRIDAAYASDLSRARETAEIVLGGRAVRVTELTELRERDYGCWEGLSDTEVAERFPEELRLLLAGKGDGAPDAEPCREVWTRVRRAIDGIRAAHPEETVLVVAPSGPVRAIRAEAVGVDVVTRPGALPEVGHCEIMTVVVGRAGRLRLA